MMIIQAIHYNYCFVSLKCDKQDENASIIMQIL